MQLCIALIELSYRGKVEMINHMNPQRRKNTNPSVKRKSFAPVDIDITPYHQLQRVRLDKIPDKERNTNIIKK